MAEITDQEWSEYKEKFNKAYEAKEDELRRCLFAKSKARIEEHNAKYANGEVTWKMAINHLADLTEEEYAMRTGKKV